MYAADPTMGGLHFSGDWMKMSSSDSGIAYAWALANVEYIVQAGGMNNIDRILERLAIGESPEAAVRAVLRGDYADLTNDTVTYLRKTYGN
jgi:hypothetical protein